MSQKAGIVTDGKGNKIANVVDYGFWPEDTMSSYLKTKNGFVQFEKSGDAFNARNTSHPRLILDSGESYSFCLKGFEVSDTTVAITGVKLIKS